MIYQIIKLIRVKQWIKNAFVLAPLLFSLNFLKIEPVISSLITFFAFCFMASTIYVINDLCDRKKDALHPTKKFRPIASGRISVKCALIIIFIMALIFCSCLFYLDNFKINIVFAFYILMNLLYSFKFKHIFLVDVFVIAFGFILRVYAGAYAIGVPVSSYIFMTTLFISLFLGFTKRKMELLHCEAKTRHVLKNYTDVMLNQYIIISVALTIMCYALYTLEPSTIARFNTNRLIYSIIFVVYGLLRYIHLLDKNQDVEDPTETVLTDKGLIYCCALYVIYVLALFLHII